MLSWAEHEKSFITTGPERDIKTVHKKPIMKTCPFEYIEKFTTKNWKFSDKNSDIFHILLKTQIVGTR